MAGGQPGRASTVHGLPDLRAQLAGVVPKLRRQALRNALAAGARLVRNAAQAAAPVLQGPARYRVAGTLRDAIRVRTSKRDRRTGDVGVFVNVRPAKRGQRGAKSGADPFYWRFLEFGWTPATGPRRGPGAASRRRAVRRASPGAAPAVPGRRFLQAAAAQLGAALEVFKARIGPAIDKLNRRQTP